MEQTRNWSKLDYLLHYAELSHRIQAQPIPPTMRDLSVAQFPSQADREREYGRRLHAWHEFVYIQSLTMRHLERAFEQAFGHSLSTELAIGSTPARMGETAARSVDDHDRVLEMAS